MLGTPMAPTESGLVWTKSQIKAMREMADRVTKLQEIVPVNAQGQPTAYVDAEIVAANLLTPLEDLAGNPPGGLFIPISYLEGFATVDSLPFWERLDGERLDYYNLFKSYRDLIYAEPYVTKPDQPSEGVRSIYKVAERCGVARIVIKTIAEIYHWDLRVKAFDAYKEKQREAIRQFETRAMENEHKKAARIIFRKCLDFIEQNADQLTAKEALGWFDLAVKLERLSLGLPPDKPATEDNRLAPLVQINQQTVNNEVNNHNTYQRVTEILSILRDSGALSLVDSSGASVANSASTIGDRKPLSPEIFDHTNGTGVGSGAEGR